MKTTDLATNIAHSLAMGAWSKAQIETTLRRRLPAPLHRLAPGLADHVMNALPVLYAPPAEKIAVILRESREFGRMASICKRRGIWPDPDLTSPVMVPLPAFSELDVPRLRTVDELADWLLLTVPRLDYFADAQGRHEQHGDTAVNHYHYLLQQKKTAGRRVIEAPKQSLKSFQRLILKDIVEKIPDHPDAFGFVKGRNCLEGASRHAGEEIVVCFDLKDFFPSIGSGRVFGMFRCLGYPRTVARYLTALCTTVTPARILEKLDADERVPYAQPHIPQGAPTSPSLANKVAFGLDRRLSALARSLNANYSRYADDLSFSGDRHIVGVLQRAVPEIVRDEGFALNRKKTRIMFSTSRQVVTGVVVNRHLNVKREDFDRLKAVIHACGKKGDRRIHDPAFRATLLGQIGWVEQVNPGRGRKLRHLLVSAVLRGQ